LYEYQQFFQHRICFSIQPQLQLVNLHRNRRYFFIKLHTVFYVNLRVKVRKHPQVILAMYFYLGQEYERPDWMSNLKHTDTAW
jgi:hypothetical protein